MANSALNAHATHHQLWSGMRVWPCLQTAPEVVLWSPPWHMITTWASPWRPSPFEKGWQEGVEVTSRSGASGSTTLLPPTHRWRRTEAQLQAHQNAPSACPAACKQPNTIDIWSASVNKHPAVNSQLQQLTPTPDLILHLQDSHHPQSTVLTLVRQSTLQQDSRSSCSTSKSPSVNQHCAEYVRVAKVKACECDHSDGYFHFILVIVHTQKQELMKISW